MSLTIGIPEKKGQKFLGVVLNSVKFEKKSNYFITFKLESSIPTPTDVSGRSLRTEVQSDTKRPVFKTKSFSFRLPALVSPSKMPSDPFNSSKTDPTTLSVVNQSQPSSPHTSPVRPQSADVNPSLVLQAFEVLQDDKGEKVQAEIQFEDSKDDPFSYAVTPSGSSHSIEPETTELPEPKTPSGSESLVKRVGIVALDLSLSDSTSGTQMSPGPTVPTPKRSPFSTPLSKGPKPLTAEIESLTNDHQNKLEYVNLFQDVQQGGEPEKYYFNITVHAGFNLPMVQIANQADSLPSPFVSAKTTTDAKEKRPAKAATVAIPNSRNVIWREKLIVEIDKKEAVNNGLFISIIDANTKKYIGKCIIPVESLVFGEQYNMFLVLNENDGSVVLLSLMLDYTYNTELNFFTHNPELHRLQVLFKGFQNPLPVATMVMAVLHVVVDGDEYKAKLKENMEKNQLPTLPCSKILLDDPDAFHALAPSTFRATFISEYSDLPVWNEVFIFGLLLNDMENPKASLVIEYFTCEKIDNENVSKADLHMSFSGYSITSLHSMGKQLENGTLDYSNSLLEITDLPIQLVKELEQQMDPNNLPLTVSLDLLVRSSTDILKGDDQSTEDVSDARESVSEDAPEESDEEQASQGGESTEEFPPDYEKEESVNSSERSAELGSQQTPDSEEVIQEVIYEPPVIPETPIKEDIYEPETPKPEPIEEDPSASTESIETGRSSLDQSLEKSIEIQQQNDEAFLLQEESRKRREESERRRRESEDNLRKRLQGQPSEMIVARPTSPTIRARSRPEDQSIELESSSEYQTVPIGWEEEILKKQELIDRLMIDLDRQTDALKKVSDDSIELRNKNTNLMEENLMLRKKLMELQSAPIEPARVAPVATEPVVVETDVNKQILALTNKLAKKTLKKNDIQKQYLEAQKTNTENTLVIQELQDENAKMKKYKKTSLRQEEVIGKFEKVLSDLFADTQRERVMFAQEISHLKEELHVAVTKLAAYKAAHKEAELSTPSKGHSLFDHEQSIHRSDDHSIPSIDMDNVRRQPVRHGSTGSYRRPSPKLHPLDASLYHSDS